MIANLKVVKIARKVLFCLSALIFLLLDMDGDEFRVRGKQMVDYMTDYLENVGEDHPVFPVVKPGYLAQHLPTQAPEDGEKWEDVFADVKKFIVPGVCVDSVKKNNNLSAIFLL